MNKFKYELETKTEGDTITQTMYFYSDMDEHPTRTHVCQRHADSRRISASSTRKTWVGKPSWQTSQEYTA